MMSAWASPGQDSRSGAQSSPQSASSAGSGRRAPPSANRQRRGSPTSSPADPRRLWPSSAARPAARGRCGAARLQARDRWNTTEFKIQEILSAYDTGGDSSLSQDDFHELLRSQLVRSLNDGRPLQEQDVKFISTIASELSSSSLARAGQSELRIGFSEVHAALRAWHGIRSLDDASLVLFAEFDWDYRRPLEPGAVRILLEALNGGAPIASEEARWVAERATAEVAAATALRGASASVDHRETLLRAICTWHSRVDRSVTSLPTIWREALIRTAEDHDQVAMAKDAVRSVDQLLSVVSGGQGIHGAGYLQVDEQSADTGTISPQAAAQASSGQRAPPMDSQEGLQLLATIGGDPLRPQSIAEEDRGRSRQRGQQQEPQRISFFAARAVGKLCFIAFPFVLGLALAEIGLRNQENRCPRDLDGVFVWSGLLIFVLGCLGYVPRRIWPATQVRIALAVMLALLMAVGLAQSFEGKVDSNMRQCGLHLVGSSRLAWLAIPLCFMGYVVFTCTRHAKRLRDYDRALQRELLV